MRLLGYVKSTLMKHVVPQPELLQEDECQYSVWTQSGIVRCEAFPEAEESFFTYQLDQYILGEGENILGKTLVSVRIYMAENPIAVALITVVFTTLTNAPLYSYQCAIVFWNTIDYFHGLNSDWRQRERGREGGEKKKLTLQVQNVVVHAL